jgi:hypothetical protein
MQAEATIRKIGEQISKIDSAAGQAIVREAPGGECEYCLNLILA